MRIEPVRIKGPYGEIAAELLLPRSFDRKSGRCALVVLMHGFLGSKTGTPLWYLSPALTREGYAVLRFDFDGYGDSDGAQENNTVPGMIEDAMAVWDYASRLPFVDRIVIIGHSQGGVVASMAAGRLQKAGTPPAALVLLASASILKEFALKGRFLSARCDPDNPPETINLYGFNMGRGYIISAQTLPIDEESSWYTGPVCLFHGTRDKIIPISCSERYDRIYGRSELHRIRWEGHLFLLRPFTLCRLLRRFLRKTLGSGEAGTAGFADAATVGEI